jgi:predicted dehydrogenase
MSIRIGIVGTGSFAHFFIPLFQAHPLVQEVVLCDIHPERLEQVATRYGIARTAPSLEALCESEVDAVVLMTQNWLHGPQALQALQAGKHVYSTVPAGITVEEVMNLVQAVEQTGLVYMLGETSYYSPTALYCRQQYATGAFGQIVYAEAEYYHDWDHGLYDVFRQRGGDRWKETAGSPPMHYATHSTSQIISVTDAFMTHVSCQGFVDQATDGLYGSDANRWGNAFSNESALFKMSDGSMCRINEFRRIGHPGATRMTLFGTTASFESNSAGARWVRKTSQDTERLDELLAPVGVMTEHGWYLNLSQVHPVSRLPQTFVGLPNEHEGAHQFLVDDFVTACVQRSLPPNHVWRAARYTIPGIVAHESALRGGDLLPIPDCGSPPA